VTLGSAETFPFRGIRFLEAGTSVSASFPLGCGFGIRRPLLHQLLVNRASEAGVSFLWGVRVGGISADGAMVDGRLVRSRWIIGADGQNSCVRRWANLNGARSYKRRFGFRRHYRIAPWSDYVEIHWGTGCQFYITPVSPQEICVVLISSDRHWRLDRALTGFPELRERLDGAVPTSYERGAISVSCRFENVVRDRVALLGDASGSVDAITGEGLCLAFQQAIALADALESGNLRAYQAEHGRLMRRPAMMANLMLALDKLPRMRSRALRALAANPAIFSGLLAAHVGARSPAGCFIREVVPLGLRMLPSGRSQGGTCLETLS
jgi:flavin-dependent dehydrogenase